MPENDRAPERLALGYYPFSEYLKRRFGCKVHKVSLHAGFTCPNRDGKAGIGGCTYCVNESFSPQARTTSPQAGKPPRSVREQMADGIAYMRARYRAKKFFAYFQAFSNTYAPVEKLRALYDEAISFPNVVGLDIGTRPDCVPAEVLDLVAELHEQARSLDRVRSPERARRHAAAREPGARFRDVLRRRRAHEGPQYPHLRARDPGPARRDARADDADRAGAPAARAGCDQTAPPVRRPRHAARGGIPRRAPAPVLPARVRRRSRAISSSASRRPSPCSGSSATPPARACSSRRSGRSRRRKSSG